MQQHSYDEIVPMNFRKLSISNKAWATLQTVCKIVSVRVECILRLIF